MSQKTALVGSAGKSRPVRGSLWRRLLAAFVAVALPPLLVVTFVVQRQAAKSLERRTFQSLAAVANQKVWLLEAYMREREGDLRVISSRPTTIAYLAQHAGVATPSPAVLAARHEALLRTFIEVYDYDQALLVDAEGTIVSAVNRPEATNQSMFRDPLLRVERAVVADLRAGRKSAMRDFTDARSGLRSAWLGREVSDNGRVLGYVLFRVRLRSVLDAVRTASGTGQTEETLLVAREGSHVRFVAPPRRRLPSEPFVTVAAPHDRIARAAADGGHGNGFAVNHRGTRVLTVYRYVPSLGWGLIVNIDRDEAFAPISQLRTLAVSMAILAVLLLVLLGWLLARSLTGPLLRLERAVERVAEGNLEQPIAIESGADEVARLSRAFNTMLTRLRERAELTRANERLEAELREHERVAELRTQLQEAEQLARLGQIASAMAHEFNNVLMGIQSLNEATARKGTFEQFTRALPLIERSIQRGQRITGEVRRLKNASKLTTHPVELAPSLRAAAADLRTLLPAGVGLQVDPCDDGIWICAAEDELGRALEHIVTNARDAMASGGVITVAAAPAGDSSVKITIADHGMGMTPEVVDRVFDPFFTTKPNATGLGLPVAQAIIHAQGGELEIDSTAGAGTTVHVLLRRTTPPQPAAPVPHEPSTKGPARRVLLVEDEDAVATGIALLLELEDFGIVRAATGAAALHALSGGVPDVVILDVRLPDIDGVELYRRIESSAGAVPVVFVTGHGLEDELGDYSGKANVAFLRKPFASSELLEALARVMRGLS